MLETLFNLFIFGGKSSLLGSASMSSSVVMDDCFELPYVDTILLASSSSISSLFLTECDSNIDKNIQDTSMLVESMSLDELYELRDLVSVKENNLKLHI